MDKCEKHLLGIVVPVFNRLENIKVLIKSMESQTFQDYTIVFVDDQSNDGTIEFLKCKKKEEFWRKRLFIIEKKFHHFFHVAKSRNDACRMLRGSCKYIMLLDSDVLLLPTFIEHQLNLMNNMKSVILLPRIDWLPKIQYEIIHEKINYKNWSYFIEQIPEGNPYVQEGTFVGNDLRTVMSHPLFCGNDINKVISLDGNWVLTVCLIISEEAFWTVGGFDENFWGYGYEDIDFGLRCERAGLNCIASDKVPGYHIWHAKEQVECIAAQNQYNLGKLISKYGINEKFRSEIDYKYWWHYCYSRGGSAYIADEGTYEILDESKCHVLKVNTVKELNQLGFMPEKVIYILEKSKVVSVNFMNHHWDHYIPELKMLNNIKDL